MEIKIRPAVFSDLDTILEIVNHQILNSTSIYDYEPRDFETQKLWFEKKQELNFPVIVAEYENAPIGYATYGTFREKEAYRFTVEHSVYVAEEFMGKGAGKFLLAELIQLAKNQGFHNMIGVIDSENQGSIDFHKKYGFQVSGIIKESGYKFDRWLDSVFMQLLL
ncbi:GNAT family N-acetyltransferase [Flavobacterium acetivorans]|uniref:GNAT family N-acetyltransferase n=1 Tax=Flavobacterium acetivorans TaxID=2893883 RepID=UPI001E40BD98|nr:GNAT family N-acetyltransferase [Flavobacterium sp. F-29]UFH34599.1 N-acetyltransferase family protein [Flavobacterium sp. F-29]